MPQVPKLTGKVNDQEDDWFPRRDLLASDDAARDFVVEIQDDGRARLRFGDDTHGRRPEEETEFKAIYRIGNGAAGNVGAESIRHLLLTGARPSASFPIRCPHLAASTRKTLKARAAMRRGRFAPRSAR